MLLNGYILILIELNRHCGAKYEMTVILLNIDFICDSVWKCCECNVSWFYRGTYWHVLGRGHTNYDIQIIVVILKVTTRFFQQRPWIIGKIIMIV